MLSHEKYIAISIQAYLTEKEEMKAEDNRVTYRILYPSLHNFNAWNQSQPRL